MKSEYLSLALATKQESIIDISITISAMLRLFEKGSKQRIVNELFDKFHDLEKIENRTDYELFHKGFCDWFTCNIKTAQRTKNNSIVKESHYAYYGHAAKILDVSLKVIVYYSGLPNIKDADRILPLLNCAIDTPLLNYLITTFPLEGISPRTVEKIDRNTYVRLQEFIREDIREKFNNEILPVQYDDIMWYKLNR
jgi:hypothetical protein